MGEHFRGDDPSTGPGAGGIGQEAVPTVDGTAIHAVLDDERRRHTLAVLADRGAVTTTELATAIAAREREIPADAVTDEQRRDLEIALYHVHVPKLAELDVVAVDDDAERVRPGPMAEPVLDLLERLSGESSDGPGAPPDA